MTNRLITLIVDNNEFTLTSDCINSYPNSLLSKMLNHATLTNKYIVHDEDVFYINRDPKVVAYMVDIYRGYNCDLDNIDDLNFKHRITHDLKLFNLYQEVIDLDILPEKEVEELIKSDHEAINDILDPNVMPQTHKINTVPETNKHQLDNHVNKVVDNNGQIQPPPNFPFNNLDMNNVQSSNLFELMGVLTNNPLFQQLVQEVTQHNQQEPDSEPESGDLDDSDNELPINELPD